MASCVDRSLVRLDNEPVEGALSLNNVRYAVIFLIALILSTAFHEFGHAIVADRLGDRLPRSQGRVTLNPVAHVDPFGTLLFPLIGLLAGGFMFGWGKPVQVNPLSFSRKLRMKTGHLLVALAGPLMNLLLAFLASIVYVALVNIAGIDSGGHPGNEILILIRLNFILAALNLLPCPPLDGGTVLAGVLPDRYSHVVGFLQQYGFLILLALMLTGGLGVFLRPAEIVSAAWINLLVRIG